MASAYSTPKQFDNYVQPVNIELVNFVLGSKEQKFNYNIAKVEQTLADFGNLGLVRGQDKEYLADRINSMVSSMGDIENMDWSDSNVERQITSGIKGAIDDKVMTDIQMSRSYTNYMQQVQKVKEKNPELYSDINFAMGLKNAGADKWIQGEADSFGSLQYMPKVDYMGQMNEIITNRIKTHGTKEVERIDNGDGTFTNITKEVLRPETVRALWQANMTPEMQQQMKMEADYMYGGMDESGQKQVVDAYKQNSILEQNQVKNKLDLYKAELKSTTDEDKRAKIQSEVDFLEQSNLKLKDEVENGVPFQEAYLNSYFKGTREKIVEANAFERKTDVELDYDSLKVLKLKRDILASTTKSKEEEAANQYSKVSDPIITENMAAKTVFERTEEGMTTAIDGFVQAMGTNQNFQKSYGITLEEFNKKTPEQKIEFASAEIQRLADNGIDLAAEKVYSTEEIKLTQKYRANKSVYDKVNTDVKSAADTIAQKSYDAMSNGVKNNSINVGNVRIAAIKDAITSGKPFNQLDPDQQNAFRVAMIDESIRRADIGEGVKPYILKQREELLSKIKDPNTRKQFGNAEILTNTRGSLGATIRGGIHAVAGVLDMTAEVIGSPVSYFTGRDINIKKDRSFKAAGEYFDEANKRGDALSLFQNDEGIKEFQGNEFIVDGKATNSLEFIKNQYRAVGVVAETTALESAPNLTSTSALIINPNIKSQQGVFNSASNYLASHNGASVADFKSSEMYMRVNPEDNTVTFSAKLSRAAAKDYSGGDLPEDRMINSNPIPIDQIQDMDAIMSRVKTDQDDWSLNSSNKYAQNLKFTTSGFKSIEERKQTADAMMAKLSPDVAMSLSQSPQSLGLTHTEMETYAEAAMRKTPQGETRSLQQEFPNAYNSLLNGAGKFEINYKSVHNQGYFMDVSYSIGGKNIPIADNLPTGDSALNPDEAYIESYQAQTEVFFKLLEGYQTGDSTFINILKEINKVNG